MSLQEFKWKSQIEELVTQDQIPLLKVTELADRAKLIRIEIPFELKEMIERGVRLTREISQVLEGKRNLNELYNLRDKVLKFKIIPINFQNLEALIEKYETMKEQADEFSNTKVS